MEAKTRQRLLGIEFEFKTKPRPFKSSLKTVIKTNRNGCARLNEM